MGFLDFFGNAVDWIKEKVEDAIDWVKDKLSSTTYDENSVEAHVDVDAVLAEFRENIKSDVDNLEKKCMDTISPLFTDLMKKTKNKFPDLVEIIENEQRKAEYQLKGSVLKYVKEHLSKNDSQFLSVLKMNPGKAKRDALDAVTKRVLRSAENDFKRKLKRYVEYVLAEFTKRLDTRITNQEEQMNRSIEKMEQLRAEAEHGQINIEALKESCIPVMESAECIIQTLEREI